MRSRRKLYFRLSKEHHPDKAGGSDERFEALNYAYRLGNHQCVWGAIVCVCVCGVAQANVCCVSPSYNPGKGSIDDLQ